MILHWKSDILNKLLYLSGDQSARAVEYTDGTSTEL